MRVYLSLVVAVASVHSYASFDLMLIGNNSGGDFRVSRWDPINRLSLGSFGSGILTGPVQDVAVNKNSGEAFVLTNGRLWKFNYSTGAFIGVSNSIPFYSTLSFDPNDGIITVGEGTGSGVIGTQSYTASLTPTGSVFAGVYVSTAPLKRPGSSRYFGFALEGLSPFNRTSATWNADGTLVTVQGSTSWNQFNGMQDSAFSGTKLYGVSYDTVTSQSKLWSSETSSGVAAASVDLATFHAAASSGTRRSISAAHNGGLWVKTGNQYSSYVPDAGFAPTQSLASLGAAAELTGMAVILAPEPGGMVALALGSLILLRRRTR
jgi:hypothetical protein